MSHLVSQSDYSLLPYIKGIDHNDEEKEKYSFLWMQYRVPVIDAYLNICFYFITLLRHMHPGIRI